MVNGVSAYQQQVSILQSATTSSRAVDPKGSDESAIESRARENKLAREDNARISSQQQDLRDTAVVKHTEAVERAESAEAQRRQSVSTTSSETGTAGKDAAQRRGSLLDITV